MVHFIRFSGLGTDRRGSGEQVPGLVGRGHGHASVPACALRGGCLQSESTVSLTSIAPAVAGGPCANLFHGAGTEQV